MIRIGLWEFNDLNMFNQNWLSVYTAITIIYWFFMIKKEQSIK